MTNDSSANPFEYRETAEDRPAEHLPSPAIVGWPEWIASALLAMIAMAQLLLGVLSLTSMRGQTMAIGVPLLVSAALPYAAAKRLSVGQWPWFPAAYVISWCILLLLAGGPFWPMAVACSLALGFSLALRNRRVGRLDYWL